MQLLAARAQPDQPSDVLCGWKRIATYLDMSVRSVQRYEQEYALPVRRPTGKSRGAVITTIAELDQWLSTRMARTDPGNNGQGGIDLAELRAGFNKMQLLVLEMRQLQQEMRDRRKEMIASLGSLTQTACQQYHKATLETEREKARERKFADRFLTDRGALA